MNDYETAAPAQLALLRKLAKVTTCIYTPLVRVISVFVHALTHRQEWISPTAAISNHARGLGICGDVLACMHTVATHFYVASYSTNTAMLPLTRRLQANTQLSKVWLNVLTE